MKGRGVKQRDATDCGAACLASVAAHFGLLVPVARIRQFANTDQRGTTVLGLVSAAQRLGLHAKAVKGTEESLRSIALPAIAHIVVREVLHHYIVIYKVTEEMMSVMDPATGNVSQMRKKEFLSTWTGALVLLTPSEVFVKGNHTRSLPNTLWALLRTNDSLFMQALLGSVIYTLLGLATSIYVKILVDHVFIQRNANLLNMLSLLMVVLLVLQTFIGIIKSALTMQTGQSIDRHLILGYYQHLLKLPQSFFVTMRAGEIISRINDAVKIRTFINDALLTILVNLMVVASSFALMYAYHPRLCLILAASIPLYTIVYLITRQLNRPTERRLMEQSADLEAQWVESIQAMATIKTLGIEDVVRGKTLLKFDKLLGTVYASGMNTLFAGSATDLLSKLFTILLFWAGTHFTLQQTLTPGELLSFYALITYFTGPVSSLIGMNKITQSAIIAADRLFEITDLDTETSPIARLSLTRDQLGNLVFHKATFRYGSRRAVFEDLSLTIKAGKLTAIVGESGSGKSTLISLVQGLYPLQSGEIRIGNYDLRHVDIASFRSLMGVVPQRIDLFSGTVIENIAPGDESPDLKRVLDISSELGILPMIQQLPQGLHTYLGENGALLSGGQKQRLAIARALYRDPEILLLDEATSSLDPAAEQIVQRALHVFRQRGKTVLFIAHRLSSVRSADHIVVLHDGRVAEQGTHDDLYMKRGKYFQLWQCQMPDVEAVASPEQNMYLDEESNNP